MLKYLLQKEIFFMDFEALFLQYKEEFIKENEELGKRKAYKTILKKIKQLFYSIGVERKIAKGEEKNLKKSLFIEKIQNDETSELTIGMNRKIVALMEEDNLFGFYANLTWSFHEVLTSYYKSKNSNITNMSILEALIEITTDCYVKDRDEYDAYLKQLSLELEKDTIPSLEHIGTYEEVKSFIIQILCNEEEFNFKEFQNIILKKEL